MGVEGELSSAFPVDSPDYSQGDVDIFSDVFHDDRLPHWVYVDSITEQTLDEFRERGVDLMIREVEMNHTAVTAPDKDESKYRNSWYTRPSPDLVLVDIDNMVVAGYEVKSFYPGERALEKLKGWGDDVAAVAGEHGLEDDIIIRGHDIDKSHINRGYSSPSWHPRGVYGTPEGVQKAEDSGVEDFLDDLYGGKLDLDEAMLI
ncbi:MAG: hypothetical protein ABEJ69_02505 [Candidatus Nanohaloarchaea archaeon]